MKQMLFDQVLSDVQVFPRWVRAHSRFLGWRGRFFTDWQGNRCKSAIDLDN